MNAQDLKDAFAQLPPGPTEPPEPHTWPRYLYEIRKHVELQDPDGLLTWSTIHATMFVGEGARFLDKELEALMADDWDRWKAAIVDPQVGQPPMLEEPLEFTTGNMIHQAFHVLQFEQMAGVKIDELDRIVEFGGGYGSLAYLVRNLGFLGDYVIYDNDEMSLIQQFYLSQTDTSAEFRQTNGAEVEASIEADLLFAAYSLSEVPEDLRENFLSQGDYEYYFFVHQHNYAGIDLTEMFDEFASRRPDKDWIDRTGELRAHRYLTGIPRD